jgi:hypothetical protein
MHDKVELALPGQGSNKHALINKSMTHKRSLALLNNNSIMRIKKIEDVNIHGSKLKLQNTNIIQRKLTGKFDMNRTMDHFRLAKNFSPKKFIINNFNKDLYIRTSKSKVVVTKNPYIGNQKSKSTINRIKSVSKDRCVTTFSSLI